jgi:hypothetical protein
MVLAPPPPFAMLIKRFWGQGLSNNMFSTLLMGGGGHAREKDHQNVKSLIIFARDCLNRGLFEVPNLIKFLPKIELNAVSRKIFIFRALAQWSSFGAKLAQKWTQKTQNGGLGTSKQPFWTAYWILYVSCSKLFSIWTLTSNFCNFKQRNFLLRQKRTDWRTRNRNYLVCLVEGLWVYPEDSAGGAERPVDLRTHKLVFLDEQF